MNEKYRDLFVVVVKIIVFFLEMKFAFALDALSAPDSLYRLGRTPHLVQCQFCC